MRYPRSHDPWIGLAPALPSLAALARRLLRFGLVGLSGVLVNAAILWSLTEVAGWHYLISAAVATEVSILTNFALNDRWTFRASWTATPWLRRAARYNGVALAGLGISIVVLAFLTTALRVHYMAANVAAIGAATLWNFPVNSRFTWGM
jgi:dolichol-phosphate mannosyltransferase